MSRYKPRYKKKPVTIEAFRMGIDPIPDWFMYKVIANKIKTYLVDVRDKKFGPFYYSKIYCVIEAPNGKTVGNYADYIIKGVNGEIYPCKPNMFEKAYEKVAN